MKIRDIDYFFEKLGQRVRRPLKIILTGGAAGILQGMERATLDIDFEVRLKPIAPRTEAVSDYWQEIHNAIDETARATGITAQYAEDIDKWSSIALPSKRSRLYRRFGKVEVRTLEPELWAIGKLTRYLSTDIEDLRRVLKEARVESKVAVRLWGAALGISPASSSQTTFRKQVENFIDEYALEIWGPRADPLELKRLFLQGAKRARRRKSLISGV